MYQNYMNQLNIVKLLKVNCVFECVLVKCNYSILIYSILFYSIPSGKYQTEFRFEPAQLTS